MAAALQCDVCEKLYKKYTVKPNHYQRRAGSNYQIPPVALDVIPKSSNYPTHLAVDLCGPCLGKVVEEYLKAIPTEA